MKTILALLTIFLFSPWNGVAHAVQKPEMVLQNGHMGEVTGLQFSPDGSMALSVTEGELKLWNPRTGELIRDWNESPIVTVDAVFSPDGKAVVVASAEEGLSVWDVESGKHLGDFAGPEACASVRISANGEWVVGASGDPYLLSGKIFVWKWKNHQLVYTLQGEKSEESFGERRLASHNLGLTSDSKQVWLRTYSQLSWWSLADGRKKADTKIEDSTFANPSPDGKTLATVPEYGSQVQLLDARSKRRLWTYKIDEDSLFMPRSVVFSTDGHSLIVTSSQRNVLLILDSKTGKRIKQWGSNDDSSDGPCVLGFSPDAKQLAFGVQEWGDVRFTTWPEMKTIVRSAEPPNWIMDYATSRDGRILAWLQNDSAVAVWDMVNGKQSRMISLNLPGSRDNRRFEDMELSPDGATVYVQCREELRAIDTKTGLERWHRFNYATIRQKSKDPQEDRTPDFTSLSLSANGKVLASIYDSGPLRCWEASSGRWLLPTDDEDGPQFNFYQHALVSPDGKWVAVSGVYDVNVNPPKSRQLTPLRLIDVTTQKIIREIPTTGGRPFRFSPDGKTLLVAENTGVLSAYDTVTLKRRWKTPHEAIGFFNGNNEVNCNEGIGLFHVRAVSDGKVLRSWKTDSHLGNSRSLKRLGKNRIAGVMANQAMGIWDLKTHRQLLSLAIPALRDRNSPYWLAYTTDNFYNGSPGIEKFLRWRTGTKLENGAKWRSHFYSPEKVKAALVFRP